MISFVNLTPHAISIPGLTAPDGTVDRTWTLPPSGKVARAVECVERSTPIAGIPTIRVRFGAVTDLPDPVYVELPTPCASVGDVDGTCPECGASSGHVSLTYPTPAVYYVVSLVTAQAAMASGRTVDDLLTPGQQIRDDAGRVIGCEALARVTRP